MIRTAVLPYGRPGVIAAVMLGLGRALGETIALAMTLGITFDISFNLIENGGNTIAANIANTFGEANETGRGALIASGLVLFAITLVVNMAARAIIYRRREFTETRRMSTATDRAGPGAGRRRPLPGPQAALVRRTRRRRRRAGRRRRRGRARHRHRRLGPRRSSSARLLYLVGLFAAATAVEGRRAARDRTWQRADLLRLRAGGAAARLGGLDLVSKGVDAAGRQLLRHLDEQHRRPGRRTAAPTTRSSAPWSRSASPP